MTVAAAEPDSALRAPVVVAEENVDGAEPSSVWVEVDEPQVVVAAPKVVSMHRAALLVGTFVALFVCAGVFNKFPALSRTPSAIDKLFGADVRMGKKIASRRSLSSKYGDHFDAVDPGSSPAVLVFVGGIDGRSIIFDYSDDRNFAAVESDASGTKWGIVEHVDGQVVPQPTFVIEGRDVHEVVVAMASGRFAVAIDGRSIGAIASRHPAAARAIGVTRGRAFDRFDVYAVELDR